MWPIIVSYYTKNTLYENQVEDLIRSCQNLGLPYDVVPIESLGSWSKNCCFKPSFLLQKLLLHRRPIVWTDADSVIVKKPELFTHLNCDMGVHIREHLPETDSSKVLSGTIFINYTSRAKRLLKLWLLECKRRVEREGLVLDQEALRDVIYRYPHGALIDHLPSSYCQIFDKKQEEAPVFIHYQASRIERALNSDNQILEVFLKELRGEDLKTFQTHQEI